MRKLLIIAVVIFLALSAQIFIRNESTSTFDDYDYSQHDGYIGLTEEQAREKALENNLTVRITRYDDEWFAITLEYQSNRVNFEIEDGKVVNFYIG